MVEMVEILDGRLRYVINNLLHLVIVKYGDISLVLCISTRLRLMAILSLLVKYLVIFHADPTLTGVISLIYIPSNTFTPVEERVLNTIKYYPRSLDFMMIKSLP